MAEITYGRWSPNEVSSRILDGTWTEVETVGALQTLTPASITYSGTTAEISNSGTVSFTGCSTVTVNSVFSSTYRNYAILLECDALADTEIFLTLTDSGSSDTSTLSCERTLITSSTGTSARTTTGNIVGSIDVTAGDTNTNGKFLIYLFNPNHTVVTQGYMRELGLRNRLAANHSWFRSASTSAWTGFSLTPSASTFITGKVFVMGFQR